MSLNDVVEVIGFLELPNETQEVDEHTGLANIVPTIHCVSFEPVSPSSLPNPIPDVQGEVLPKAAQLRDHAISSIQTVLLGDRVAAEYLYLSLFSNSTERLAGVPSGQLPLNIYSPSFDKKAVGDLLLVLQKIKPDIALLPLSISSLNNSLWMQPHQARHDADHGLCRGEFQAPSETCFLFDETEMDVGNLTERGTTNLQTIQTAVEFGLVEYGLHYGSITKECDFGFVFVGKAPTLISGPTPIPISEGVCDGVQIIDELAQMIQVLVAFTKTRQFTISEEMEQVWLVSNCRSSKTTLSTPKS
ncbi:hypothetical protein HDV03_004969 [Kappamyces sp. JEL0829]|nr:hypothetical protein HDV03_004969 [Kappamyces sp. JEL0829]